MEATEFLTIVKNFLRMDADVSMFDAEIIGNINTALNELKVAGIVDKRTALIDDYVTTYVRLRMTRDMPVNFQKLENERLMDIIDRITYGGV